jgi:plasmid stabilization system protein ParE
MSVEFHPAATEELDASADWYAARSPTAAQNFLVAVDLSIESIVSDPDRFAAIDDRHRGCGIRRFPFQIIFRHEDDRIVVIAVAHTKRRPGYWRSRD